MTDEHASLLPNQSHNYDTNRTSEPNMFVMRPRSNTINSLITTVQDVKKRFDKRKFIWVIVSATLIYLGFIALFAPRTSLSRDMRRWVNSRLTNAEVYRIYLNSQQEPVRFEEDSGSNSKHSCIVQEKLHEYLQCETNRCVDDYLLQNFKDLGFDPISDTYYPWLSEPIDSSLQVVSMDTNDTLFEASLTESENGMKSYHLYSPNGNVTGQFVYVNYGSLADYKYLLENDIDIEGKIHVIKYGNLNLGLKLKNAELYGAISALLFNDPADDGHITKRNGFEEYPMGPARNSKFINHGTVNFFTDEPGDPTTPGYPSKYRDIERISPVGKIPRIPSLPVSFADIKGILKYLNGTGIQIGEKGNIDDFSYTSGPSNPDVQIKLSTHQNHSTLPINNIIVDIPGIFAEGETIIAAHRDSWGLNRTASIASSNIILLEIAKGFSTLIKHGWKPLRPIRLISWDGTHHGLIGSTEYVENYLSELTKSALLYLNLDNVITGTQFNCRANPLLKEVIFNAAKYTSFKGREDTTLFESWLNSTNATIYSLHGDSDCNAFQYHLGIPSASLSFQQNNISDAIYPLHSTMDTINFLEKWVDPDYKLHSTLSSVIGLVTLMVSENELNMFKVHSYFENIYGKYIFLQKRLMKTFPHDREIHHLSDRVMRLLELITSKESVKFDKDNKLLAKQCKQDYPIWSFMTKIRIYLNLLRANDKIKQIDRLFVTKNGLKDRNWLKHSVFASDKFTGIDTSILPGISESIEEIDRDEMHRWLNILILQLNNARYLLK